MYSELIEVVNDAAYLAEEEPEAFALIRRQGLGASDSSIILGVNNWTTVEQLIEQKNTRTITPEEIEVGNKPNVRMGRDCEEIILKKFAKWSGFATAKPPAMYRLKDFPMLTVNYDGLTVDTTAPNGIINVPVECKTVSMFADKYWDKSKAIDKPSDGKNIQYGSARSVQDHVLQQAAEYGIPPYYYTQVQQQLMGTEAKYAYMAVLFVKTWEFKVYKIYEDQFTQEAIISKAAEVAPKCHAIPAI